MPFTPAVKQIKHLRLFISGVPGAGKTYTALTFATVLAAGGRVAVIDTERNRASLFADLFPIDVNPLTDFDPLVYIAAIHDAETAGYKALVIDSFSHAWSGAGGVLDQVSAIKAGNKFTDGWGKVGTPLQNQLLAAILDAKLHVVCTARSKMAYEVETNANGKSAPKKVGLAPVQRDDTAYEFDFVASMDADGNTLHWDKTPILKHQGKQIAKPGPEVMKEILVWLNTGAPGPIVTPAPIAQPAPVAAPATAAVPAGAPPSLDDAFSGEGEPATAVASTQPAAAKPAPAPTSTVTDDKGPAALAAGQPAVKDCPLHGALMSRKTGKNGGAFYSHKLPNGDWCNGVRTTKAEATSAAGK